MTTRWRTWSSSRRDYTWITTELVRLAGELCDGHVVSTLEGGYNLRALGASAAAHVEALMAAE